MDHTHAGDSGIKNYWWLGLMVLIHAAAMYALMYAMVNVVGNVYLNHNQLYMALLMTAPMLILELWFMSSMYLKRGLNIVIVALGMLVLVGSFLFIRNQVGIDDAQFLKSMIPHHAGAILMCEQAALQDQEVKDLCAKIISGQQAEINWMKAKLGGLQ